VGKERRIVSLATGAVIPPPASAPTRAAPSGPLVLPVDKYAIPRAIHIRLWFGAGVVVAVATFAMLALVVLGPFLSPPRYRNTALGWHTTAGWLLFPLMLFLPLTGGILVTPFLQPKRELLAPTNRLPQPLSVAEGLAIASKSIDLGELRSVQQMPNGRLMIQTQGTMLTRLYVVSPEGSEAIGGTLFTAATMVHKGSWLGAWSGIVNLAGAIGLMGLLSTGTWSWVRRWRLRRRRSAPPRKLHDVSFTATADAV
jgi:sulfite reductase (NADPH) flavoprotein alpha-component